MAKPKKSDTSLKAVAWSRYPSTQPEKLISELYEPALRRAVRYDRAAGYFSSTILSTCARGFGDYLQRLLARPTGFPKPSLRLLANTELEPDDLEALLRSGDEGRLSEVMKKALKRPSDVLEMHRLEVLAWLYREGHLDLRVAVMRRGDGIAHAKFGIFTDTHGQQLCFHGSNNETLSGIAANYEQVEVRGGWEDPVARDHWVGEFDRLWNDKHAAVRTVDLPTAIREELLRIAPAAPPKPVVPVECAERDRAAARIAFWRIATLLPNGPATADATAPVALWDHQRSVVSESFTAWPEGRLLCDEVGMGKTIEAALVLRRLLLCGSVRRVLLLLPKNVCLQWQGELREKAGLRVPVLRNPNKLAWPDGKEQDTAFDAALEEPLLLVSRELARRQEYASKLLAATPWDLVLLDEAHHARRTEGQDSGNLLLQLLRKLVASGAAGSLMLLSATPMQLEPYEPWDLCGVLGEGGSFNRTFEPTHALYQALANLERGAATPEDGYAVCAFIRSLDVVPDGVPGSLLAHPATVATMLTNPQRTLGRALRKHLPLHRRMHRNTRETLRRYHRLGILPKAPPRRDVQDKFIRVPSGTPEREVYDAITGYIDERYDALEKRAPGMGFVMTVYRRRAASSPKALLRSLERRRNHLLRQVTDTLEDENFEAALDADEQEELEELFARLRKLEVKPPPDEVRKELEQLGSLIPRVQELLEREIDAKFELFLKVLDECRADGRAVLVFTGYSDTLNYLAGRLAPVYGECLARYSGDGGSVWDPSHGGWRPVDRSAVTSRLKGGSIQVLLCTDAANEGLNLQAASALINYDLPWNPSKVEQRIGRIDRIGQAHDLLPVRNLFMEDSVERDVYEVLKTRCGLFTQFVGKMQPVLALARQLLLQATRRSPDLVDQINRKTDEIQSQPYADITYDHHDDPLLPPDQPALSRAHFSALMADLVTLGIPIKHPKSGSHWSIGNAKLAADESVLQRDVLAWPLQPSAPPIEKALKRCPEPTSSPFVYAVRTVGATTAAACAWLTADGSERVTSLDQLNQLLTEWDGFPPELEARVAAQKVVEVEAFQLAASRDARVQALRRARSLRLREAAASRLHEELGLTLAAIAAAGQSLNHALQERQHLAAVRSALERLSDEFSLVPDDEQEFRDRVSEMSWQEKKARNTFQQVDQALLDWRWRIATTS